MTIPRTGSIALCLAFLAACSNNGANAPAPGKPQPVPVVPIVISPRTQVLTSNLPGRVVPERVAEVRARVPGIVQNRHFVEGSIVKKGDLLFSIDAAPLQASMARALAAETRAKAIVKQSSSLVRRYEPLVKADAVSQQEYDDAVASLQTAEANRLAAEADVRTARLDLGYATVRAPITGRIGKSLVSEGALVGQGETTPMATIQQMDPIYADFTQPANTVLQLREALAAGNLSRPDGQDANVTISVDGTSYIARGRLLFSDITVDQGTGQVTLRGKFANPDGILLPGMYVRVNAEMGIDKQAIFVPQRAIIRGTDGMSKVMTISAKSVAEERQVKTGVMQDGEWQILEGLKAGDRVIVKNVDKIASGTPVVASTSAPRAAAPSQAKTQ